MMTWLTLTFFKTLSDLFKIAYCAYLYQVKMSVTGLQDHCSSALREHLHTHKVFTKDQCFYLNYHKFSIKSYVVDVY